jgi:PIN domain nuclease of toxin-antitoxin system
VKLLLDTHTFLWLIAGDAALSPTAREVIEKPNNEPLLSMASLWEMAIKVSLGKLTLSFEEPFAEAIGGQLRENGMTVLPIDITHVSQVASMPFHHRDPFDRLIAAQALVEKLPLVGRDQAFDSYGVQRIW